MRCRGNQQVLFQVNYLKVHNGWCGWTQLCWTKADVPPLKVVQTLLHLENASWKVKDWQRNTDRLLHLMQHLDCRISDEELRAIAAEKKLAQQVSAAIPATVEQKASAALRPLRQAHSLEEFLKAWFGSQAVIRVINFKIN